VTSRRGKATRLIGRAHLAPPVLLRADPAGQPGVVAGLRISCDWEPLPGRSRYVAGFLRLTFHDRRVSALELRTEPVESSVSVLRDGSFGWSLGNPHGNEPIPPSCEAYLSLLVPDDVDVLSGTVRVDVTATRMGTIGTVRDHARGGHGVEFALEIPPEWRGNRSVRTKIEPPMSASKPAVRLCVAADTERYSRFGVPEAARAQERFVDALASARRHAGLTDDGIDLQQSGDGQFAILPPGIDESAVIPKFVEGIRLALAEINSDLSERARLRLRIALHRGHVRPGVNGWIGGATIAVHRLLDCDAVRKALTSTPEADFALIVADVVYQDVIADHYGLLDPASFNEVTAIVEAKNFTERAWVHVAGAH
jgi:hypothetical protein